MLLNNPIAAGYNLMFAGKVVVISGGATGIGYEIAKQFLRESAGVYIISRKLANIEKAVESLQRETGSGAVWGSSCDVRKEDQLEQTINRVVQQHGDIHVVVNGAAGNFLCPFEKLSANAFRTVLMIDTVGTFLLSKYAAQYGFKHGGVIINISANLHYNGTALQTHAGTAKAGVDALTKHMAVELGPRAIRVVGICPGIIENTVGFDKLSLGSESSSIAKVIPLQRLGRSADIAQCAVYLASEKASYITGQTIVVDGGVTLTMPNFPFSHPPFLTGYSKL